MGTTTLQFFPVGAGLPAANAPALALIHGANFSIRALSFDDTTDESCFWQFRAMNYGGGMLTIDIDWYTSSATGGSVVWQASIAAVTPNDDSQDLETKVLAVSDFIQQTHRGDVAKRTHRATLIITNLNSLAKDDILFLKLNRDADSTVATDDMAGDAHIMMVTMRYAS